MVGERGPKSQVETKLSPQRRHEVREALTEVIEHPGGIGNNRYKSCADVHQRMGLLDEGVSLQALQRWYQILRVQARIRRSKELVAAVAGAEDLIGPVERLVLDDMFNLLIESDEIGPGKLAQIGHTVAQLKRAAVAERKDERKQVEWEEARTRANAAAKKMRERLSGKLAQEEIDEACNEILGIYGIYPDEEKP